MGRSAVLLCLALLLVPSRCLAASFVPTREEFSLLDPAEKSADRRTVDKLLTNVSESQEFVQIDDMVFRVADLRRDSGFLGTRWPNGVVYYEFDVAVSPDNRARWLDAAADWSDASAVLFVPRSSQENYIYVVNDISNSSSVGMVGGQQVLRIANWSYKYIIAHEIGHALGLMHEHSRSDRDSFVTIFLENVLEGKEHNFSMDGTVNYGPYDFDSCLHYGKLAFTSNTLNTIEPLPAYSEWLDLMGQRTHLSDQDKYGMAMRYGPADAIHDIGWSSLPSSQIQDVPFQVTVTARDVLGGTRTRFEDTVTLAGIETGRGEFTVEGDKSMTWYQPMRAGYQVCRTECIYLQSEVGDPGDITSLALAVDEAPGGPLTSWTIRMQHTLLSSHATGEFHNSGWTTVHVGTVTVGGAGWVQFDFDTPFPYNGWANLLIDLSFVNPSAGSDGHVYVSAMSANRSIYRRETSGDPLMWPASSWSSTLLPDVKFGSEWPVLITPTSTTAFTAGVWSGTVTVQEPATNMFLRGDDGRGGTGDSTCFDVEGLPAPPALESVVVADGTHVDVTFDMAMGAGVATPGNYTLSGTGKGSLATNPNDIANQNGNTYRCTWNSGEMFHGGDITITVSDVYSTTGTLVDPACCSATDAVGAIGVAPTVESITRVGSSPTTASFVTYSVAFSEGVTGVGTADFALTLGGVFAAWVTGVADGPITYTVTVATGLGEGTLRLDVDDDNSVLDGAGNVLGGASVGDGDYTGGEAYTLTHLDPNLVHVDFGHGGFQAGSEDYPYATLEAALSHANPTGTVRVQGDTPATATGEALTIDQDVRIETVGGSARFGDASP